MTVRMAAVADLVTAVENCGELPTVALEHVAGGTGRLTVDRTDLPLGGPAPGVASVKPGDVLFGKLRPYLAKTWLVDREMYASTELMCLRPKAHVEPRLLAYLVASRRVIDWSVATAEGTKMPRTSWEKLRSFRLDLPPRGEQRAIADFLDTETARIDALITKKRRLIELLAERVALIIEERFATMATEERPLRRLLADLPQYGASESGDPGEVGPESPRYIRITDLDAEGGLRPDAIKVLPSSVARPFLLRDGDLLFARSGATVGKAFRYREGMGPAAFAGYLIRLRLDRAEVLPELVEHWTQTKHYWGQIRGASVQATIENVSAERYKELVFPLPPRPVQRHLVEQIETVRATTQRARASLVAQLDLLVEHRQALITAAVTGELAVPGAAA